MIVPLIAPYLKASNTDLKTISKFAQLEYKLGDPERGKTLFEGIVESHPKRFDLWSIYMDMEAGQGAIHSLRYGRLFSFYPRQVLTTVKKSVYSSVVKEDDGPQSQGVLQEVARA
jgi:hypothetical protein